MTFFNQPVDKGTNFYLSLMTKERNPHLRTTPLYHAFDKLNHSEKLGSYLTNKGLLHFKFYDMRNITTSIKTFLIIVAAMISSVLYNKAQAQMSAGVSFDIFYDELSPYGNWAHDTDYGDIWYPNLGPDFRPYGTNGYWVMTEYGNTWVSDYPWGWAPFHYGRWVYNRYNGWGWIPGYEWGPAWVEWRSGNGYYGWAPMSPRIGVSISVGLPIDLWVFVPSRHIYQPRIHRYWSHGHRNIYNRTTIINNTYIVNNHHYHGGPRRADIERSIGRRVEVRNVRSTNRPGSARVDRKSVSIYRPERGSSTRSSATTSRRPTTTTSTRSSARSTNNDRYDFRTSSNRSETSQATTQRSRASASNENKRQQRTSTSSRNNSGRSNSTNTRVPSNQSTRSGSPVQNKNRATTIDQGSRSTRQGSSATSRRQNTARQQPNRVDNSKKVQTPSSRSRSDNRNNTAPSRRSSPQVYHTTSTSTRGGSKNTNVRSSRTSPTVSKTSSSRASRSSSSQPTRSNTRTQSSSRSTR